MERLLKDAQKLTGVKYDIKNLDDVYEAIHAIQAEMGITGTTAKEATETFTGSLNALKSSLKDTFGNMALGENIGPSLEALGSTFSTFFFNNFIPMVGNILSSLPGAVVSFVQAIGPQFMSAGLELIKSISSGIETGLPGLIDKGLDFLLSFSQNLRTNAGKLVDAGLDMILKLAQGIADALPTLIQKIPQIVINIAGVINDNAPKILATGIKIIITLVKGIINAIPTIIQNIPLIIKAIISVIMAYNWIGLGKQIMGFFKNGISSMVGAIKTTATNIKDGIFNAVSNLPNNLLNLAKSAGNGIVNGLSSMLGAIRGSASSIGSGVVNVIKSLPSNLLNLARSAGSGIANGLSSMLGTIKGTASSIGSGIVNAFTSLPSKMIEIGKNLIKGLWNGIKNVKDWILSQIGGFADSIISGIKKKFGIASPSKIMRDEIGKWIPPGIAVGIEGNTKPLINAMDEVARLTTQPFDMSSLNTSRFNLSGQESRSEGKTIIQNNTINSPTPLSPSEFTRQAKNLSRQLAMEW